MRYIAEPGDLIIRVSMVDVVGLHTPPWMSKGLMCHSAGGYGWVMMFDNDKGCLTTMLVGGYERYWLVNVGVVNDGLMMAN